MPVTVVPDVPIAGLYRITSLDATIELALATRGVTSLKDTLNLTPRGWFMLLAHKEITCSHRHRLMAWVDAQLIEYGLERTWAMHYAWPFLAHIHSETGKLIAPRDPSPQMIKMLMNQIRSEDRAAYKKFIKAGIFDDDFSWQS